MRDLTPRQTLLIGVLALIPVVLYGVLRGDIVATLAALSILVILGALYRALEPIDTRQVSASP